MMRKNSTSPLPDSDIQNGRQHQYDQQQQDRPPQRQLQQAWVNMKSDDKQSMALSRVAFACALIAFVQNTVGFSCAYWVETQVAIPVLGTNEIHIGETFTFYCLVSTIMNTIDFSRPYQLLH